MGRLPAVPLLECCGLNPILPFLGGGSDAACRVVTHNRDAARYVATKTCGWSGSGQGGHSLVDGQLSARPYRASLPREQWQILPVGRKAILCRKPHISAATVFDKLDRVIKAKLPAKKGKTPIKG